MKNMFKRVFSAKKPESVSKSHRYPIKMWEAIEQLATLAGETPNAFVVLVLDQYLQTKLEDGTLSLETVLKESEKTA